MIDIHCHILPGLDDGPESLGEALDMSRAAATDGVKVIVAAPHFKPGAYEFTGPGILESINTLEVALKNAGIDIRIVPGAEVTVSPEMPKYLKQQRHLTINSNGRYFLAEFSPHSVPANWDTFLLSLLRSGLAPIIAHPERNFWFMHHPEALAAAVQSGILVQITAMSITGAFGVAARDFSAYLLRHNLVHAIASDGHCADFRPPRLAEAVGLAADIIGPERANALVTSIPQAIIEGQDIPVPEPFKYYACGREQKRSWFQRASSFLPRIGVSG
ncbi:MAG: CpsB/CapC family capsule biosynthesis tyrosine phosphatase [Pseudomonadota bacterium]